MADNLKNKISAKARSMKKKAQRRGLFRRFPGNDTAKLVIKAAICAAAAVALAALAVTGADLRPSAVVQGIRDKQAFIHAYGSGYPVDVSGSRAIKTACVTGGTAVMTDTSFEIFDGKGRQVFSEAHYLASPVMENDGKYSLLFERMGKDFTVMSLSGVAVKGKTDDSIICGDISRSGRFVFATTSETTNARVCVFSRDGRAIHKWKSVDYKISDICISPSGKYIAISGISSDNGVLTSTVIIQQVGVKENIRQYTFDDTLVLDIEFDGNSRVTAVGDDLAAFVDVKKEQRSVYPFNDRTLHSYDFSQAGDLALVFSGNSDGRNASVVVIDASCREAARIDTSMTAPYVDLENGRINVLYQSVVSSYNYKGKLLEETEVSADCRAILTSQGRLLAKGIMYIAEVE